MTLPPCPRCGSRLIDGDTATVWCEDCLYGHDAPRTMVPQPDPGTVGVTAMPAERIHELKTWPEYYARVVDGSKPFEVRKDDRPYEVGHALHLREWSPESGEYTGRSCYRLITYILKGGAFGVAPYHCVLGLAQPAPTPQRTDPVGAARCKCGKPVFTLGKCKDCNSADAQDLIHDGDYQ